MAASEGAPRPYVAFFFTLGSLVVLAGSAFVDHLLFSALFDASYVGWYLENGVLISLVVAALMIGWDDINRNDHLIAANPARYLAAQFLFTAPFLIAFGAARRGGSVLDLLATTIIVFVVLLLTAAYLVVVVPLQYLVFLICGAPARTLMVSELVGVFDFRHHRMASEVVNRTRPRLEDARGLRENYTEAERSSLEEDGQLPRTSWIVALGDQPVTFTYALAALLLLALRMLVT